MVHVQGLRCRECGREYEAAPIFTCEWCFGPLEVAYDYDAIARVGQPREDRGRPADALALRRPAAGRGRRRGRPRRRLHAARARRPPRRPSSASARCGSRTTPRNPTNSFKDRVVVGRAEQGARVRLQGRGVRVHRQPRQLGRRPRGARRAAQLRVHPRRTSSRARSSRPRSTAATSSRSTATTTTSTACAPSSPASYPWAFVNVNMRTVLRRGLEDARVRDRRAARLAGARPRRRAGRERLAAHQDPQGLRRAAQGRPARRGAAGAGVAARRRSGARRSRPRGSSESDTIRPVKPDTIAKSLAIGNPADGYFALDAVRQTGGGFARGHRRRDRRRHAAARAHRGDLRRDRRRRDRSRR